MNEWCGWPVVDEQAAWESAQQILTEAELSDGLPLVPPTQKRLDTMIAGVAGPAESQGMMPPMFGDITPEAVAYQCVIAGCVMLTAWAAADMLPKRTIAAMARR